MNWILCALATMVLSARAEDILDLLPTCAVDCASELIRQANCSTTDLSCICLNSTLTTGISSCGAGVCTVKQTLTAINGTAGFCQAPVYDKSLTGKVVTGLFGGLSLLFVLVRMYTRLPPIKVNFGWDDVSILVAEAAMIPLTVLSFIMGFSGFGTDIWTIPFDTIDRILLLFYIGGPLYDVVIIAAKISILLFYMRIFPERSFRIAAWTLLALCILYMFTILPPTIRQCAPLNFIWKGWSGEMEGSCLDVFKLTMAASLYNIALDVLVILLPIPYLLKLKLSVKKKIQIVAMFCVGLFVTIVSVIRLQSAVHYKVSSNFSRDYDTVGYMSILEANVSIICACMPALQLVLRRLSPRLFGSTANPSSYVQASSRSRTYRNTDSHMQSRGTITKTITNTIRDLPKDSDSVIELVDNKDQRSFGGRSLATVSSHEHKSPA